MKVNKNLSGIPGYKIEVIDDNLKRSHANELFSPIIPEDYLFSNIFRNINYYPEEIYGDLTSSSADFYKINSDFIIPVNGSDEGIDLIIRTFCNPGDVAVLLDPTFSMYQQYGIAFGLNMLEFSLDENFNLNIDGFIEYLRSNAAKIVFIPNPLAPSGGITKRDLLERVASALPETFVVIDEAYIEFSQEESMLGKVAEYPNLIVTRTLSKFYGLAGIRLGFIFTSFKQEVIKVKSPYNVNTMTCRVGINLFNNLTEELLAKRYYDNILSKRRIVEWLTRFKQIEKVYSSYTNFVFIKLNCNSAEFAKILEREFFMKIKAFSGKYNNFCRISF